MSIQNSNIYLNIQLFWIFILWKKYSKLSWIFMIFVNIHDIQVGTIPRWSNPPFYLPDDVSSNFVRIEIRSGCHGNNLIAISLVQFGFTCILCNQKFSLFYITGRHTITNHKFLPSWIWAWTAGANVLWQSGSWSNKLVIPSTVSDWNSLIKIRNGDSSKHRCHRSESWNWFF